MSTVSHYNLLERIGDGGAGAIYRARDTRTGRTVALTLVRAGLAPADRDRLLADARAAGALSHPNLATLFDAGEHEEAVYLCHEFVSGATLRQQTSGGAANTRRALDLAIQVADALAYAHERGICHEDLRPETILETGKGSAKVLDMGMSRWTDGGRMRRLAAAAPREVPPEASMVVAYMSPEQALASGTDARTDVFSLALIAYEMITAKHPFAAADVPSTLINITRSPVAPPSSVNPELPAVFDGVFERALAKPIDRRTESAARLAGDLRRCRAALDTHAADPPPARSAAPRRRSDALLPLEEERSGVLWWLIALLAAATAGAVWMWVR